MDNSYIDDLIITGNNNKEAEIFITHLCNEFKCRDLGLLNFFLRNRSDTDGSLVLNQSKYAPKILAKHKILECKPAKSLVSHGSKLNKSEGELLQDVTSYRALVGFLQFLLQTRSDLTHAIN